MTTPLWCDEHSEPYCPRHTVHDMTPCNVRMRRGWRCLRTVHVSGPCVMIPKWWNLRGSYRYYWCK